MHILSKNVAIIKFVCALLYALFLPYLEKKPRSIVICYHKVTKNDIENFGKQMRYLVKNFEVVKLARIKTAMNRPNHVIAVTFDDGFKSIVENALPILKKYDVPAAMFIPTGNLNHQPKWFMDKECTHGNEIVMDEHQIAELDKEGFEILSHTVSHPLLTKVDDSRLQAELLCSKQKLEKIVGHKVLSISYPHGTCDSRVYQAAKDAGYKYGFSIEPCTVDCSSNDMAIGRFMVSASDSLLKFRLKVSGAYQVEKYLRAVKQLFLRRLK